MVEHSLGRGERTGGDACVGMVGQLLYTLTQDSDAITITIGRLTNNVVEKHTTLAPTVDQIDPQLREAGGEHDAWKASARAQVDPVTDRRQPLQRSVGVRVVLPEIPRTDKVHGLAPARQRFSMQSQQITHDALRSLASQPASALTAAGVTVGRRAS